VSTREDDMELLSKLKQGDVQAFDRFYKRFVPFVYRIAYQVSRDRMEAEDVCHDVFLEVFDKALQYDPSRGSLKTWLSIRTRCRAVDRVRKKRRVQVEAAPEERWQLERAPVETPEQSVLCKLERESLRMAMLTLPAPQRSAVYGTYYEYRTQKELAETLQRPLGTIKSLVRYGLHNMRKQLPVEDGRLN
jgi:RNA polymerase sigma factor (sigma-70 family)